MKKIILLTALFLNSAFAKTLSFEEAKKILNDSFAVSIFSDTDYSNHDNIIRSALAGLYDARATYLYISMERKEKGLKPLPANYPLFKVGNETVLASSVISLEENSPLLKNIPKARMRDSEKGWKAYGNETYHFSYRIDKKAVELAAPYYTGHKLLKHYAPSALTGDFFAEDVYFDGSYYYLFSDAGHDTGWKLENVKPDGNGYLLTGTTEDGYEGTKGKFSLKITPSDEVKGTWKRKWNE